MRGGSGTSGKECYDSQDADIVLQALGNSDITSGHKCWQESWEMQGILTVSDIIPKEDPDTILLFCQNPQVLTTHPMHYIE